MTAGDADSLRESFKSRVVERAVLDQIDCRLTEARCSIDTRIPRRKLGPAAQAGSIAFDFRSRGAWEEMAILAARRPHRAYGAAIDSRRRNADKEAAVETRVMRCERAVTTFGIEHHGAHYAPTPSSILAVFGPRSNGAARLEPAP